LRANPDGSVVRVRDVARVELGSEQYGVRSSFDGRPSATLGIYQTPDANAVEVMEGARATMKPMRRIPSASRSSISNSSGGTAYASREGRCQLRPLDPCAILMGIGTAAESSIRA
jgi:multidrug efflux pump subunit AcrB